MLNTQHEFVTTSAHTQNLPRYLYLEPEVVGFFLVPTIGVSDCGFSLRTLKSLFHGSLVNNIILPTVNKPSNTGQGG